MTAAREFEGAVDAAAMDLDILIEDKAWIKALPEPEPQCRAVLMAVYALMPDLRRGELSLALTNDTHIQGLNRDYRQKDRPTNVLSFPAGPTPDDYPMLGDIVIALETVSREAREKSIDLASHFTHLFLHGFLHLQGYDHETPADAEEMESLEINVLKALHIQNPYLDIRDAGDCPGRGPEL